VAGVSRRRRGGAGRNGLLRPATGRRDLLFLSRHVDFRPGDAERLANTAQFREMLAEYGNMPALLGGDFYDTPGNRTHAATAAMFDDVWETVGEGVGFTIPSREPNSAARSSPVTTLPALSSPAPLRTPDIDACPCHVHTPAASRAGISRTIWTGHFTY
jgi:hypothetical protein